MSRKEMLLMLEKVQEEYAIIPKDVRRSIEAFSECNASTSGKIEGCHSDQWGIN